jgi:hypothetical protein
MTDVGSETVEIQHFETDVNRWLKTFSPKLIKVLESAGVQEEFNRNTKSCPDGSSQTDVNGHCKVRITINWREVPEPRPYLFETVNVDFILAQPLPHADWDKLEKAVKALWLETLSGSQT